MTTTRRHDGHAKGTGFKGTNGHDDPRANELAELDESSRLRLSDVFAQWEGRLAALQRMVESGELDASANVKQLSIAMMASRQGGRLLSKTNRSAKPLDVALDSAIEYLEAVAASA